MKPAQHHITHQYQPTSTTCAPTSLSMLLGYYSKDKSVGEISREVPQVVNEHGEQFGTINQQLATYCLSLGFDVELYTFDCQIIDQCWNTLPSEALIEKLELRKTGWIVPALGALWSREYAQSYIDYIQSGGVLHIEPFVTSKLLYELLQKGPVLTCVSFSTLNGTSRVTIVDEATDKPDDIHGRALNHTIILYGYDENGDILVADPGRQSGGNRKVTIEQMLAAISTAQIECDNVLFQLHEK